VTNLFEKRTAEFSPDRVYRDCLEIVWDSSLSMAAFVALNPSTADEIEDDNTIRREKTFARDWGCGGLLKLNIFAIRATDPRVMLAHPDPIGPVNTIDYLAGKLAGVTGPKIAAWGVHGAHMDRGPQVLRAIPGLQYLRMNNDGSPAHPLYLPATSTPRNFSQPCPDCQSAAKLAYSDATTPGFMYYKCDRHRNNL
jgi:hypothetical protein